MTVAKQVTSHETIRTLNASELDAVSGGWPGASLARPAAPTGGGPMQQINQIMQMVQQSQQG